MKTELFENADVAESISEFGNRMSLSNVEFHCRIPNFDSVFVKKEIFSKRSSCGRGCFYADKKDAFSKRSGYKWMWPKT